MRTPIGFISDIEISQCLFYDGFDFKIELGWPPIDFTHQHVEFCEILKFDGKFLLIFSKL